jgi:hypothetical protein
MPRRKKEPNRVDDLLDDLLSLGGSIGISQ